MQPVLAVNEVKTKVDGGRFLACLKKLFERFRHGQNDILGVVNKLLEQRNRFDDSNLKMAHWATLC